MSDTLNAFCDERTEVQLHVLSLELIQMSDVGVLEGNQVEDLVEDEVEKLRVLVV